MLFAQARVNRLKVCMDQFGDVNSPSKCRIRLFYRMLGQLDGVGSVPSVPKGMKGFERSIFSQVRIMIFMFLIILFNE